VRTRWWTTRPCASMTGTATRGSTWCWTPSAVRTRHEAYQKPSPVTNLVRDHMPDPNAADPYDICQLIRCLSTATLRTERLWRA